MSSSLKSTGQFCKCSSGPFRLIFLLEGDLKNRTQVALFYFWQEYHRSDVPRPGEPRCQYVTSLVMLSLISWLKWCLPGFSFESNGQKPFQSLSSGLCPSENYSLSSEAGLRFFKLCLHNLTYTSILNFYFPEPWDNKFLLFKPKQTNNNKLCALWCIYKLCNYDVQTQCTNQGQARLLVEALTGPGVISNRFL